MPLTFVHPVAVVPLGRWPQLRFSGLAIGSMIPDFGYFFPLTDWFKVNAHTFERSFTFCLPVALLVFFLFFLTRRGWAQLTPEPFRSPLLGHARLMKLSWRDTFWLPFSILIGTWTHIAWDSATHRNGWTVNHFDFLNGEIGRGFYYFHLLQHVSTAFGLLVLAFLLWKWKRAITSSHRSLLRQKSFWHLVFAFLMPGAILALNSDLASLLDDFDVKRELFHVTITGLRSTLLWLSIGAVYFSVYLTSTRTDGNPQPSLPTTTDLRVK